MKKISSFQLLTSLAKSSTLDVLRGSECTSLKLTININKPYMAKTNYLRTLRQAKQVYLKPGEPFKQHSQRNQMTYLKS